MPTQQLPTSLPSGWESDYDATSERWFFVHRPTGYSQFFFPKAGDENTRVAQLAQPQPTNASLVMQMDAMAISETTNTQQSNGQAGTPIQTTIIPQPGPMQAIQPNTHNTPPVQAVSTPQPSQHVQKSPTQRSPLARTGTIQRKAIPRSGSVHSQASTTSSQLSAQPNQQHQVSNPQIQQSSPQYVQNVQNSAQAQPYQQPQHVSQVGLMQQTRLQAQPTSAYYQNQAQHPIQSLQSPAGLHSQNGVQQSNIQGGQYQQVRPLQSTMGQPVQKFVQQVTQASFESNQTAVQSGQQQHHHHHHQHQHQNQNQHQQQQNQHQQNQQQQHQQNLPQQQYQHQQPLNPQSQPQNTNIQMHNQMPQQNMVSEPRRSATIPVSHYPNGQTPSSSPQITQYQGARHASIGMENYQPQPLIQQMQPVSGGLGQPIQSIPAAQHLTPQSSQQGGPIFQSSSGVQYVQQHVAPLPQGLPPPAPGMKWVLVQPGSQQSQIQPAQNVQKSINPNHSPHFSIQTQQYQGGAAVSGRRPGLITRLSSSSTSKSKNVLEASKTWIKKHPGSTIAIAGVLGVVAEASGVNVVKDAEAASKVYTKIQHANANAQKKSLNATQTSNPGHNQVQHGLQASPHNTNPSANGGIQNVQYILPQTTQHFSHPNPNGPTQNVQYILPQTTQYVSNPNPNGGSQSFQNILPQTPSQNPQAPHYIVSPTPSHGTSGVQYVMTQASHQTFPNINNPNPNVNLQNVQHVMAAATHHTPLYQQQNTASHMASTFVSNMASSNSVDHATGSGGIINPQAISSGMEQVFPQQNTHQQSVFSPALQQHHVDHVHQHNSGQQTDPSNQSIEDDNTQLQYAGQQFSNQQDGQDPSGQFIQNQNALQYLAQQSSPVQSCQPFLNSQFQSQLSDSSQLYQDNSGQITTGQDSGGLQNYATDAFNLLPGGQGNQQSQPQSPSLSNAGIQSPQQRQPPSPSGSQFDPSSQLQQLPTSSTPPLDPSLQQFPATSTTPLNPSPSILQAQFLQDQASAQMATQSIESSQQFTTDLEQSLLIQEANIDSNWSASPTPSQQSAQDGIAYSNPPSPSQQLNTDVSGQCFGNPQIQDDNGFTIWADMSGQGIQNQSAGNSFIDNSDCGQGLNFDDSDSMPDDYAADC